MKPHILIFVGPPGSGKGTLASLCVERLGFVHVSTGNLCRKHVADKTKIGQKIDFTLKSGNLIGDELVSDMIFDWVENHKSSSQTVILDGYPRTVNQVNLLSEYLDKQNKKDAVLVVRFVLDDVSLVERVSRRFVCSNKDCQQVYARSKDIDKRDVSMKCATCGSFLEQRLDDTRDTAQKRLALYRESEEALLQALRDENFCIRSLEVDKAVDRVFQDLCSVIDTGCEEVE